MLFGCAAKPRGEKLFGFSPSYSHYNTLLQKIHKKFSAPAHLPREPEGILGFCLPYV